MTSSSLTKSALQDIIQWDIENWSRCLPFWEKHIDHSQPKKVLALGEREGGISLYFALNGHDVICSDYNPLPESTVHLHQKYKVADRVSYQALDMKAINLPDESVDIVVFKSVLGALSNTEDQEKALKEIHRVLKKDGIFLFAENLEGSKLHKYLRNKFVKWGKHWRYIKTREMLDWGDAFADKKTETHGVVGLFGRSENQRRKFAGLDRFLTPITPQNWRYILFGAMKK